MNRNDNEGFFWLCVIGLGLIVLFIYFQVKAFAEWVHLDWSSAAWLLGGFLALAAGAVTAFGKSWGLGKLFPWMLCGFYLFLLPALNYWSLSGASKVFGIDGYESIDGAWYGNGWWQLMMFAALASAAYGLNKLQDDRY